jgi:uncharacterized protein YecE (DUF72 family)
VLEVRHASFLCPEYLALARAHGTPSVFTDSQDYPSFADLTGDFVYARLMRSHAQQAAGYTPAELDAWAGRARRWAEGSAPDDLPHATPNHEVPSSPRDVFIFFISSAKQRNPAAAMALQSRIA